LQTDVLVPHGLSDIPFTLGSVRYEESAYLRIEELKPGDEFTGAVIVHHGFRDNQLDRPLELMTDAPRLPSASGFQDRVAEAAQDQGLRHQSGWIIFDKKNRLDGHAVCTRNYFWAGWRQGLGGR